MSGAIFGGDEVGAIVIDVGTFSTRAGFAGQDRPEIDIPTFMGFRETGQFNSSDPKYPSYLCGVNRIHSVNDYMDIINPITNGQVNNWSAYEALINHTLTHELHVNPEEHPILLTEQPWSISQQRETIAELYFERFEVPALYVSKSPVLTSFAYAKSTSLVIDSGYSYTSVTPVVDGYPLKKSTLFVPRAGAYLADSALKLLKASGIDLTPNYMIAKREPVSEGEPPVFTLKPDRKVKNSWKEFMTKMLITDFYTSVFQVSDIPLNENHHQTTAFYEFPTGYYKGFCEERYTIPENLFAHKTNVEFDRSKIGVHDLAMNCAISCDIDVRSHLLGNICISGGTTLLSGFNDRFQHSLSAIIPPNMKYKILTSYPGDRRFTSWVGGSILASMGTFHQLWVSKSEYMESGRRTIDMKCP